MSTTTLPQVGQKAPDFCLPDQDGKEVCLKDLQGKWVVLYFYPKDNTSGCTIEAIEFTQLKTEFEKLGTTVLGISKDSVKSHKNFCEKHSLGITLLSDAEKKVLNDYGVWQLRKVCGKESYGTIRSTFLIAPDATIKEVWFNVKAKGHAQKVLEKLKELINTQ